jgi:hypothetical protein
VRRDLRVKKHGFRDLKSTEVNLVVDLVWMHTSKSRKEFIRFLTA